MKWYDHLLIGITIILIGREFAKIEQLLLAVLKAFEKISKKQSELAIRSFDIVEKQVNEEIEKLKTFPWNSR